MDAKNPAAHLQHESNKDYLPRKHTDYLYKLKADGFEPKVIYDIGSCILHWTNVAKKVWPEAKIILFDAFQPAEFLYTNNDYHIGVLSDSDDRVVKFYQNDFSPGGNSYYREIGCKFGNFFPEDKFVLHKTKTLDTVINERGFPLPDFIKIDVQGAEIDVLRGASKALSQTQRLIVELQHEEYNLGAMLQNESLPVIESLGFKCTDPLFQNNGPDGDYGFLKM